MQQRANVPLSSWIEIVRGEHLARFVKQGGSALKVVAPRDGLHAPTVLDAVRKAALEENYVFAEVSAAKTKVHQVQEVFHEVARQVDWRGMAARFSHKLLSDAKYKVPEDPREATLENVASLNSLDVAGMRSDINRLLSEKLLHDYAMSREFRTAMLNLCRLQVQPTGMNEGPLTALEQWLRGELRLISNLGRDVHIYRKVGRHNARSLLYSLAHFLHLSGKSGLVLAVDIGQLGVSPRRGTKDEQLTYAKGLVFEAFEVLRQFLDSTDELNYSFIAVIAPEDPEWLVDKKRGLDSYQALKLRVYDDVFDASRANPLASLVRLQGS